MTSFTSDKNINYLQYQLRQIFPENKWTQIQSSVREAAIIWFKQHGANLELIYERDGLRGLNNKFIADMIASAEYFENTNEPAYRQDQLFDTDITDPNIVADQPMPYVTGVENPLFTFSTFSKTWDAKGNPSTQMIYRNKPSYGADNFMAHTLQGPGERVGPIKHYSDGNFVPKPTDKTAYNITDRLSAREFLMNKNSRKQGFGAKQGLFSKLKGKISGNYGTNMQKNIYNTDQPKFFPNAYSGYQLGTIVDEYSPNDGDYVPMPNNLTSNTMKTINQMRFGDIPVATMMSDAEIAMLGSQLYRAKDHPKRQRAPRQDGKCIPRQEFIEIHDDYPVAQVRAKFHLDQIYNTPESRINTIMDPVMGKSAMYKSQERSVLEIPCYSMTGPQPANAADRYDRQRNYADGYADSQSVPGCNYYTEPKRQAYPTRDFVPPNYTTNYQLY